MKMKTICENKFTGYRREIHHAAPAPTAATLKRHIRASRASDCQSTTTFYREDGARLDLNGNRVEVLA